MAEFDIAASTLEGSDMVVRLIAIADDLAGIAARLLADSALTASIYVDAAGGSLRYATEVIEAELASAVTDTEPDVDPRLLEWLM